MFKCTKLSESECRREIKTALYSIYTSSKDSKGSCAAGALTGSHGRPPPRDCTFLLKWGRAADGTSAHWKAVKLFSSYREQFGFL